MKVYICMGIMALACVFSFFIGKNVGAEQTERQAQAQVVVVEPVQQEEHQNAQADCTEDGQHQIEKSSLIRLCFLRT